MDVIFLGMAEFKRQCYLYFITSIEGLHYTEEASQLEAPGLNLSSPKNIFVESLSATLLGSKLLLRNSEWYLIEPSKITIIPPKQFI